MTRTCHARFLPIAGAVPPSLVPPPLRVRSCRAPWLLALAGILVMSSPVVRSQEVEGTDGAAQKKASILLRVLCKKPVAGAADLKLVQGEKVSHDLAITTSLVSDPLAVGRGEILLVRNPGGEAAALPAPILKLTIPEAGDRFILALFAALNPTPEKPYEHRLVRTDGLNFGASDVYLFNLTRTSIGGTLGKAGFKLRPAMSEVVTPKPDKPDSRVYQSRFYYEQDKKPRLFNDTRWPLSRSARIYLFFIPDPARSSVGYLSFREYEPFP